VTFNTSVKVAVEGAATDGLVHCSSVPPAIVVQVQPLTVLIETNVVCAGNVSSIVTVAAAPGPLFVTVSVYVMLLPPTTVLGVPVFVTARSAWLEEEATTVVTVA
jgi:hypothetical protein